MQHDQNRREICKGNMIKKGGQSLMWNMTRKGGKSLSGVSRGHFQCNIVKHCSFVCINGFPATLFILYFQNRRAVFKWWNMTKT